MRNCREDLVVKLLRLPELAFERHGVVVTELRASSDGAFRLILLHVDPLSTCVHKNRHELFDDRGLATLLNFGRLPKRSK